MSSRPNPQLSVDGIDFVFQEGFHALAFDETKRFRRASGLGIRGCDIVARHDKTLWLIEVKDYTHQGAKPPEDLYSSLALKSACTIGLLSTYALAEQDSGFVSFARDCRKATKIVIALHIELKDGGRKSNQVGPLLLPIRDRLRQVGKSLGVTSTLVTSTMAPHANAPWVSERVPDSRSQHEDR